MSEIPTTGTITLTPHWPGVRRYVEAMAASDLPAALNIAAGMGCEAPDLEAFGAPAPQTFPCGCATRNGFAVRGCADPSRTVGAVCESAHV